MKPTGARHMIGMTRIDDARDADILGNAGACKIFLT